MPPHFTGIDSEETLAELQATLVEPHFELWNETSLVPLYISLSGYNGPRTKEFSLQLLRNYADWKRNRGQSTEEIEANIAAIGRTEKPTIVHHTEDRSNTWTIPISDCSVM